MRGSPISRSSSGRSPLLQGSRVTVALTPRSLCREPWGWTSASVAAVATIALIHGGGGSAWDWHLAAPALRERGHDAVAVDRPSDDESAGWEEYTDAVERAVGDRRGVVV